VDFVKRRWRSDKAAVRSWPVEELLVLFRRQHPNVPDGELRQRAETLSQFHTQSVDHQRYEDRKFKRKNLLTGGELFTDTDDRFPEDDV
jgi:hypothetical protein